VGFGSRLVNVGGCLFQAIFERTIHGLLQYLHLIFGSLALFALESKRHATRWLFNL
jgi:hypothetical protein